MLYWVFHTFALVLLAFLFSLLLDFILNLRYNLFNRAVLDKTILPKRCMNYVCRIKVVAVSVLRSIP